MSLNNGEIDLMLQEADLAGHYIQKVIQPDFRNLYVQLFRSDTAWWLRVSLEHPWVRFHPTHQGPRSKRSHQRFEDFLWARVKGGRIRSAEHVNRDRIVRLVIERDQRETLVYFRFWGTRSNVIATDADGVIIDAFFRKPSQGVETGATFEPSSPPSPVELRPVRHIPADRTFADHIASSYQRLEDEAERERLLGKIRRHLEKERSRTQARLLELSNGQAQANREAEYRHWGNLILSSSYAIRPHASFAEVPDYEADGAVVRIPLDPTKSAATNADAYFERARRSSESASFLRSSSEQLTRTLARIIEDLDRVDAMPVQELRELLDGFTVGQRGSADRGPSLPGLEFQSHGFRILVGRNARENDGLLRRGTKGNDWWFHTRDVAGGYVFVSANRGKSVPLEVQLDAGNLAVFFSKARNAGRADLYYTQVKYLRRARSGPTGLVLPTQEKNLSITLDQDRLKRLGIGNSLTT